MAKRKIPNRDSLKLSIPEEDPLIGSLSVSGEKTDARRNKTYSRTVFIHVTPKVPFPDSYYESNLSAKCQMSQVFVDMTKGKFRKEMEGRVRLHSYPQINMRTDNSYLNFSVTFYADKPSAILSTQEAFDALGGVPWIREIMAHAQAIVEEGRAALQDEENRRVAVHVLDHIFSTCRTAGQEAIAEEMDALKAKAKATAEAKLPDMILGAEKWLAENEYPEAVLDLVLANISTMKEEGYLTRSPDPFFGSRGIEGRDLKTPEPEPEINEGGLLVCTG